MRNLSPSVMIFTLGLTLVLVSASAYQWLNVPLWVVALAGLGAHAAALFLHHREKLSRILGPRARVYRFAPPNSSDLNKAA